MSLRRLRFSRRLFSAGGIEIANNGRLMILRLAVGSERLLLLRKRAKLRPRRATMMRPIARFAKRRRARAGSRFPAY